MSSYPDVSNGRTCCGCAFYQPTHPNAGECRRRAPTNKDLWFAVIADYWCGEFEPKNIERSSLGEPLREYVVSGDGACPWSSLVKAINAEDAKAQACSNNVTSVRPA